LCLEKYHTIFLMIWNKQYTWYLSVVVLIAMVASSLFVPLVLSEDPAMGFNIWKYTQRGIPFNVLIYPNPSDMSLNRQTFLSWWSPGQYLIPIFISWITRLTYERSSLLVTSLCLIVGVWGWYKLYQKQGYESSVIAWSLFFIISSRVTTQFFLNYTGGETLIFGIAPWSILCFEKRKTWTSFKFGAIFLIVCLLGFFFKTSFSILLLGLVVYHFIEELYNIVKTKKIQISHFFLQKSIIIVVITIIYVLVVNDYLKKGPVPTDFANDHFVMWYSFIELIAFPIKYWFSLSDFSIQLLKLDLLSPTIKNILLVLNCGCVILFLIMLLRVYKLKIHIYNILFFIIIYVTLIVFLGYYIGRETGISFDARHFKVASFLLIPIMLTAFKHYTKYYKLLIVALFLLNPVYSMAIFAIKKVEISKYPISKDGFALKLIDRKTLEILTKIDKKVSHNNIIFITDPCVATQIEHTRSLIGCDIEDFMRRVYIKERQYRSSKPVNIYIFVSRTYLDTKSNLTIKSLFLQKELKLIQETATYEIYLAEKYITQ
jgi:hypothetical protein